MRHDTMLLIEQIFELRKDRRYRAGFLQAVVSLDAITQEQWLALSRKYIKGFPK